MKRFISRVVIALTILTGTASFAQSRVPGISSGRGHVTMPLIGYYCETWLGLNVRMGNLANAPSAPTSLPSLVRP